MAEVTPCDKLRDVLPCRISRRVETLQPQKSDTTYGEPVESQEGLKRIAHWRSAGRGENKQRTASGAEAQDLES